MARKKTQLDTAQDAPAFTAVEKPNEPLDFTTRWRLLLGRQSEESLPGALGSESLQAYDRALEALYDDRLKESYGERRGGGGPSTLARYWLGDIRRYFPASVVRVLQKDALDRLGLKEMLLEPETLAEMEADVGLLATLLSLRSIMPDATRDTARMVVRKVADEVEKKLKTKLVQSMTGALDRAARNRRPRPNEIDWNQTIRANLKNYIVEKRLVIPERLIGYARRTRAGISKEIILCVDQSGSMMSSVVYAGIFAAVMATVRAVRTSMVVFDTSIVDLTEQLADPVSVLFSTQLGGGTDINRALAYCERYITRPADSVLVLISDLYEGGDEAEMRKRAAALVASGVLFVVLLALDDAGAPAYDAQNAHFLTQLGVPVFACTPDLFPDMIAAALQKRDLTQWATTNDLALKG